MNERIFHDEIEKLRQPERIERSEIERVIDLSSEGIEAGSVLDVGTGTALFAEHFVKRGFKVCGIDINPKMIEAARQYVPQGEFKISGAEAIPYPDQSFDLVFFGYVLHEADDYLRASMRLGVYVGKGSVFLSGNIGNRNSGRLSSTG